MNAKRVEMLFTKYKREGYEIFIQGDEDNNNQKAAVNKLAEKGLISKANTFTFKYDFESAFPPDIMLRALQKMGKLSVISLEQFRNEVYSQDVSIVKAIKLVYNLDITPLKVALANVLAEEVMQVLSPINKCEGFRDTEIGQFLDFIHRIPSMK
jgi:hypothetical protein